MNTFASIPFTFSVRSLLKPQIPLFCLNEKKWKRSQILQEAAATSSEPHLAKLILLVPMVVLTTGEDSLATTAISVTASFSTPVSSSALQVQYIQYTQYTRYTQYTQYTQIVHTVHTVHSTYSTHSTHSIQSTHSTYSTQCVMETKP